MGGVVWLSAAKGPPVNVTKTHHHRQPAARDERGEGVISAAIAVLVMAFIGVGMWVAFNTTFQHAGQARRQSGQLHRSDHQHLLTAGAPPDWRRDRSPALVGPGRAAAPGRPRGAAWPSGVGPIPVRALWAPWSGFSS